MTLSGVVEFDEMYLVAGHKGQPDNVKQAKRPARRRRLKGARGRGTLANEKPPIFGMIQRSGEVVDFKDRITILMNTPSTAACQTGDFRTTLSTIRQVNTREMKTVTAQ